ncbi:MAG TPA: hypothetical protein DIS74_06245 [Bacteroidales bacterium]|nr:hypothetical protein [Bacteroidales bacterium]
MIKLTLTGDVALSGIISGFSETELSERINLREVTGGGAFVINLEAPVADEGMKSDKSRGVKLHSNAHTLDAFLKHNPVAAVTLANNHSLDYGHEGVRGTIGILDANNIPHTGAGYLKKHLDPAIFSINGIVHALLGYVHPETNPHTEDGLFLNIYDRNDIVAAIEATRAIAERVILSLHWGRDYSAYPMGWQIEDAHAFIDAGADIVAGHHPHVVQPFEKYRGKYIFYSLGSTVFGDFLLRGRLRALPLKTKRAFVPLFADLHTDPSFCATRELKGNRLVAVQSDVRRWSGRVMKRTFLRNRSRAAGSILNFKEIVIDRLYDILFGYYRNPVRDIFNREAIRNALTILRKRG